MYSIVLMMALPSQAPQAPAPVAPVPQGTVITTPAHGEIYYVEPHESRFSAFFHKLFKKHETSCGCGDPVNSSGHGWFKRHADYEIISSGPVTVAPPAPPPVKRAAEPLPLPKDSKPLDKKDSEF